MNVEIAPKEARKVYGGDGGAYFAWFAADLPMLSLSDKGASRLHLHRCGFAPPTFSDSAKMAYVLQGQSFNFSILIIPQFFVL